MTTSYVASQEIASYNASGMSLRSTPHMTNAGGPVRMREYGQGFDFRLGRLRFYPRPALHSASPCRHRRSSNYLRRAPANARSAHQTHRQVPHRARSPAGFASHSYRASLKPSWMISPKCSLVRSDPPPDRTSRLCWRSSAFFSQSP
jgi:hypothetical protein